jgi:hypothetical protein
MSASDFFGYQPRIRSIALFGNTPVTSGTPENSVDVDITAYAFFYVYIGSSGSLVTLTVNGSYDNGATWLTGTANGVPAAFAAGATGPQAVYPTAPAVNSCPLIRVVATCSSGTQNVTATLFGIAT